MSLDRWLLVKSCPLWAAQPAPGSPGLQLTLGSLGPKKPSSPTVTYERMTASAMQSPEVCIHCLCMHSRKTQPWTHALMQMQKPASEGHSSPVRGMSG